jgi:hypothetical protein
MHCLSIWPTSRLADRDILGLHSSPFSPAMSSSYPISPSDRCSRSYQTKRSYSYRQTAWLLRQNFGDSKHIQVIPVFKRLRKESLCWYMQQPMAPDACMQTPEPLLPSNSYKRQNLSLDLCAFFHFMILPDSCFLLSIEL